VVRILANQANPARLTPSKIIVEETSGTVCAGASAIVRLNGAPVGPVPPSNKVKGFVSYVPKVWLAGTSLT
jgi:hypothetical protein